MPQPRSAPHSTNEPPRFLQLAANSLRWTLLRELTVSDRTVSELTQLAGEPQNLVSYHLRKLRESELVRAHRSAADGRDVYYAIDLEACRVQLQAAGTALHPALAAPSTEPTTRTHGPTRQRRRPRTLFLCTGNSARSQMGEALIRQLSDGAVDSASAGSKPKPLHPNAVRVMRTRGIDISANRTKHFDELVDQRFDTVITLCDRVREVCPDFPEHPHYVHWSIPDPARDATSNRASLPAFERTAAELETRIRFLLPQLANQSTSPTTKGSDHAHR